MSEQKQPSIGRVVHYVHDGAHVPALIVEPEGRHVFEADPQGGEDIHWIHQGLSVFTMNGVVAVYAAYDTDGAEGTWHWPEFVPAAS